MRAGGFLAPRSLGQPPGAAAWGGQTAKKPWFRVGFVFFLLNIGTVVP